MERMVKLQRRHFEYIADAILGLRQALSDDDHWLLTEHFANRLSQTNAQFQRQKFIDRARGVRVQRTRGRARTVTLSDGKKHIIGYETE